jgi:hypothetical protein
MGRGNTFARNLSGQERSLPDAGTPEDLEPMRDRLLDQYAGMPEGNRAALRRSHDTRNEHLKVSRFRLDCEQGFFQ